MRGAAFEKTSKTGRGKGRKRKGGGGAGGGGGGSICSRPPIPDTSLAREAEQRYLTYALSVITSRALSGRSRRPQAGSAADPLRDDQGPRVRPDGRYRRERGGRR